jgi:hypothetical protein
VTFESGYHTDVEASVFAPKTVAWTFAGQEGLQPDTIWNRGHDARGQPVHLAALAFHKLRTGYITLDKRSPSKQDRPEFPYRHWIVLGRRISDVHNYGDAQRCCGCGDRNVASERVAYNATGLQCPHQPAGSEPDCDEVLTSPLKTGNVCRTFSELSFKISELIGEGDDAADPPGLFPFCFQEAKSQTWAPFRSQRVKHVHGSVWCEVNIRSTLATRGLA